MSADASLPNRPPRARSVPLAALAVPPRARTDEKAGRFHIDLPDETKRFALATATSALVHFVLVIVLATIAASARPNRGVPQLTATFKAEPPVKVERLPVKSPVKPREERERTDDENVPALAARHVEQPVTGMARAGTASSLPVKTDLRPHPAETEAWLTTVGGSPYGMLDGRDSKLKAYLLRDGATQESEDAVLRGLRWLAAHQRDDGSWHFNHTAGGGCQYCSHPGNHGSAIAATGLALLPFLGAGQTHVRGEFTETVRKGLDFIKRRMILTPLGGDLQDGITLYAQGIATLALCEAYALTGDRELDRPCREAITFIVNAQDKNGGGWRYYPGQVGDTTVTGWMLMALKSGQLSYMPIPPDVQKKAWKYLDSVQDDSGAAYGYQGPSREEPTMTAIGLLCRMYGGWPRRHPSLIRGVRTLSRKGPSPHDLYFNYYAAQVLRHYGGEEWIAWNEALREQLIRTQAKDGHENGSWYFKDKHGDQGGRLYNTAMAILTLEVYYRYLPIYGTAVLGDDFGR
jgi:hypothetical protein